MANDGALRFFNCFIDMHARKGPRNMLHLIFDPDGMRSFIADWDSVTRSLLERVQRESIGQFVDRGPKTARCAADLSRCTRRLAHAPGDVGGARRVRSAGDTAWFHQRRRGPALFFAGDERRRTTKRRRARTSAGVHVSCRCSHRVTPRATAGGPRHAERQAACCKSRLLAGNAGRRGGGGSVADCAASS